MCKIAQAAAAVAARGPLTPSEGFRACTHKSTTLSDVRLAPTSGATADFPLPPLRATFGLNAPQQRASSLDHLVGKTTGVQSVQHGFSVRPLGNFVFALPHASANCFWVNITSPLRSTLISLAPLSVAKSR